MVLAGLSSISCSTFCSHFVSHKNCLRKVDDVYIVGYLRSEIVYIYCKQVGAFGHSGFTIKDLAHFASCLDSVFDDGPIQRSF